MKRFPLAPGRSVRLHLLRGIGGFALLLLPGTVGAQDVDQRFSSAWNSARYVEAEAIARQQLAIAEGQQSENNVAVCSNNLAVVHGRQGRYAEAEPLYKQALANWEKSLGTDDPLSVGAGPPRLCHLQRRLPAGNMLSTHFFGEDDDFVLVAGTGPERVDKLAVPEVKAKALGIKAGPLTAKRLQEILIGEKGSGLMTRLATSSSRADDLWPRLATLWRVLVPEAARKSILEGKAERLAIIPDGPLALLPFEAPVVEEGREPKYLLDAGPPVLYAASATVLYNLTERPPAKPAADREPVPTVRDPAYGEVGIKVGTLSRAAATERGVRDWAPGRRVLLRACQGLADQEHGNVFGALALTPGPNGGGDAADDGSLTLAEFYELYLKGIELTILSSCQTNCGPQQKGEGTRALSRGFLVAGSRRVVASNWLVNDEAAASLVSVFCAGLAQAEKAAKPLDHAEALQAAKRVHPAAGQVEEPVLLGVDGPHRAAVIRLDGSGSSTGQLSKGGSHAIRPPVDALADCGRAGHGAASGRRRPRQTTSRT